MRWLLPLILFAVMSLFTWQLIDETPRVKTILLTDGKHNWKAEAFTCPRGSNFYVVLGVPIGSEAAAENTTGNLSLMSNGTPVVEIPFETRRSTMASWLSKRGLRAYVLNWPTNAPASRFNGRLIPGSDYEVKLDLHSPSPSGSLWFVFTQTQRDRRKP